MNYRPSFFLSRRFAMPLLGLWLVVISAWVFASPMPVDQWEVAELEVELPSNGDNPFDRLPLADLTGPDGSSFTVPGYYAGDGAYVFRVSLPSSGDWQARSRDTGEEWDLRVSAKADALGPLTIPEDKPQSFRYANGEDCFMLAFEADWLFALDLETGHMDRTRTLLEDIKANGFNQIVMNVYAHDVNWPSDPKLPAKYDFARPKTWPYGGDNDAPDYERLNLAFFDHFDKVIAMMNELDLTAHIMIYVWNKNVNWPEADSIEDNRYFDYVVARYQGFPNVLWDISKEATGYGHNDMEYIVRRTERLRELDGHERLLTVHAFNYCVKYPETVDFMSTQNWTTSIYERMLDAYQRFEDKPIFNIEHGGYEKGPYHVFDGDYDDAVACVDRNYRCAFAGAYSCYYWQDTSWSVVIWDQSELPKNDRPRYDLYRNMAKLFGDVDYGKYRPFDRRTERRTSSGYVMGDDAGNFLIYLPEENSRLSTTFADYYGKPMKVRWFNTITGEYSDEEEVEIEKWLRFEAPWQGVPRVLILSQP
ncbi:MAG: hypothetical protein CBD18_08090 [Opitutales bacterium TMED158]|nr:MAG: hypothetical protein CBD18_08090 [Opitutales bacterium TMED158]